MTNQITAAVLRTAPGELTLEQLLIDDPEPDEVRVRVAWSGLCHSDLHEMDGTFPTQCPIVLGHEAAGIVEAVGDNVVDVAPGDHVVPCLSASCGTCGYCLVGQQTLCERRESLTQGRRRPRLTTLDGQPVRGSAGIGAFAEQALVHRSMVAKIPDDFPLDVASILGCVVTTGMGAVPHSARVGPGESVAVIGLGGVGIAVMQAARLAGAAQIIGIDIEDTKLTVAQQFGATDVINARQEDSVLAVRERTSGGVHHAFEAVGTGRTVGQALAMVRPGGTATAIGMIPAGDDIPINGEELFVQEKRLRGSFMGSNHFKVDIPRYIALRAQGRLMLDEMVTDRVQLSEINAGFNRLARAGRHPSHHPDREGLTCSLSSASPVEYWPTASFENPINAS
jgi:S-(hydroxymethyl)glutathione dehydrogenase/alcohol dehydrogenase